MCVVYVDNTIFPRADAMVLEAKIAALGVNDATQRHQLRLRNEGEAGAFHGIQNWIDWVNAFYLSQPGLLALIRLQAHAWGGGARGADVDGKPFFEEWNYRTAVIGMFMFISANTLPDIALAVRQAARFSHFSSCFSFFCSHMHSTLSSTNQRQRFLSAPKQHSSRWSLHQRWLCR